MERVVVAMSGGLDSSVAAALLVEQGYDVIGVMLRLWVEPAPPAVAEPTLMLEDLPEGSQVRSSPAGADRGMGAHSALANRCCSLESIEDARSVAARLDIPFYVVNVEAPFKERVVDPFVRGYASGITPNPCLACNRQIRFGYLLDYARSLGGRFLATGHYVRIARDPDGTLQLLRGADPAKDQSYVLSVLGQSDLAQALFPVGPFEKLHIRALAAARGLPSASRVDSQDLCFVSDGDLRRFLAAHAPESALAGPIVDRQGRALGTHRGLMFYTIGQRSGLEVPAGGPHYVLELDSTRNALVVGSAGELESEGFVAGPVNWISGELPHGSLRVEVQVRYRAAPVPALVTPIAAGRVAVALEQPVRGVAPGQAAVFYLGDRCLGGGPILRA